MEACIRRRWSEQSGNVKVSIIGRRRSGEVLGGEEVGIKSKIGNVPKILVRSVAIKEGRSSRTT